MKERAESVKLLSPSKALPPNRKFFTEPPLPIGEVVTSHAEAEAMVLE